MIKILLTAAVLGSVGSFTGLAMAQDKQGETFGSTVSSSLARLEAQCAHRRHTMPPDERDGCARRLRGDAQIGYGQGGDSASSQTSQAGPGNIGPGIGPGIIGPGNGNGNGNAKGRR
jgi:hypothetical protein